MKENFDGGNLVPLIMDKCFEKYFGDKEHPNRIEKLIQIILVREGFKDVKFIRFFETNHTEKDDGFGIVDVECLCDDMKFNIEVTTSYKDYDFDNAFLHLADIHTRDVCNPDYFIFYYRRCNKSIQICINMTGIDYDQCMLRSDNTNKVYDDSFRTVVLNTLYYLDKVNDDIDTSSEMDKILSMFVVNDYDKLNDITKTIPEYQDLASTLKAYSNDEDILSSYDIDKYLSNINDYESSVN